MRRYPIVRVLTVLLTICMMLATLAGCTFVFGDAHIRGAIYGDPLLDTLSASTKPTPLAATVRCNGVSVTASAAGKYDLKLPASERYKCTVSAPPNYVPQSITLPGDAGVNLRLDVGVGPTSVASACEQSGATARCPTLHLKTGSITGKVTYHGGGTPASGALVRCTSAIDLATRPPLGIPTSLWPKAQVDSRGGFSISALDPGLYDCFAVASSGDMQHMKTLLLPGGTASVNFSVCAKRCNPVHYHDGPVMHTYTAYLIFWLPNSYTFEPSGDDARFESSIAQYFKDVGGTPYYGLLKQYWDYHGFVQNSATLGDVYVDTHPYQQCNLFLTCTPIAATRQAPLSDQDIQAEIERAIQAHKAWHTDLNSEFFVFTGYNAEECSTTSNLDWCTFTPDRTRSFCGYHESFNDENDPTHHTPLIYAYMPDNANSNDHCSWSTGNSGPHGDDLIDSEIDVASHEQFESVSDPLPQQGSISGWYDDSIKGANEIGDKCVDEFGTIRPDGSNVTLANGHTYFLQAEWSNRVDGCAFT